jgi:Zn-dependent protease with chaperone function
MEIIFADEAFRTKVEHLTKIAERNPILFRVRVTLLVVAGYSFLLFLLLSSSVIVVIAFWQLWAHFIEFGIIYMGWAVTPAIIFAGMVWRALWIELPEPQGIPIDFEDAPELFQVIEETRRKLDTAPIHSVQFDGHLNAGFTQRPRLGIFGWTKGYLTIGLPLLLGLSTEDLRAIIVHELGHFSRNHSRFASWIYSVNKTWEQFLHECQLRRGGANAIFVLFGNWYQRELRAHSFMLARRHEYEADLYTAELCGEKRAAESLLHLSVMSRFVGERFWPQIWQEAELQAAPPMDVFTQMRTTIEKRWSLADDAEWRKQVLTEKSDFFDYHPSLSERLAALGQLEILQTGEGLSPLSIANRQQTCAANEFIGTDLSSIMDRVNELWSKAVRSDWEVSYRDAQTKRQRLEVMRGNVERGSPTDDQLCQYAQLIRDVEGDEAAQPIVEGVLQQNQSHAKSHVLLAHILLKKNQAEGVAHAEKAMELDADLALEATLAVEGFLSSQGKQPEATEYLHEKVRKYDLFGQTARQKRQVGPKDRFSPHCVTKEQLVLVIAGLRGTGKVSLAFLAMKQIDGSPPIQVYVLGIVLSHQERARTFAAGIDIYEKVVSACAPLGDLTVVILDSSNRKLRRVLGAVQGSQILP